MGTKHQSEPRRALVVSRLTRAEAVALKQIARQQKVSPSSLIRTAILRLLSEAA